MYYLTFTLTEPDSGIIKCVGVKYKKTHFSEQDIEKIRRNGTSNKKIKIWLKDLKKSHRLPVMDILYKGNESATACWHKQQVIIKHEDDNIDLIGTKISTKKYTKRLRTNEHMRRPVIDQHGRRYSGVLDAGEKLLLAPSNISKVLYGKLEHIGGYKFKFDESLTGWTIDINDIDENPHIKRERD